MNKKFIGTLILAIFLVIPISTYAYNSVQVPFVTKYTTNEKISEDNEFNNRTNTMNHHDYLHRMMNGMTFDRNFIDCPNLLEHQKFIEEQKALIEQRLQNKELTLEQADEKLNALNQIDQIHRQHHNNTINMRCH